MTGLRNVAAGRGLLIPASGLGKGKMATQVVSIFLLLLSRKYPILHGPGLMVLWLVVVLALVSAVDYFRLFWRELLRPGARPEPAPHPGPLGVNEQGGAASHPLGPPLAPRE